MREPHMPTAYTDMPESQWPHPQHSGSSMSATPFWMVPETPYPSRVAPNHSKKPPRQTARPSGIAPEPTDEPQELAESFAPMQKHMPAPMIALTTRRAVSP